MRCLSIGGFFALAMGLQVLATDNVAAVKRVVVEGYVKGVKQEGNPAAVRENFHKDFTMLVKRNDLLQKVTRDDWIEGMIAYKKEQKGVSSETVDYKLPNVDVAGDAAVVRVDIYSKGRYDYTDYFSLYRFSDGWKIVNKIYFFPPPSNQQTIH